jgi:hypothetical protein
MEVSPEQPTWGSPFAFINALISGDDLRIFYHHVTVRQSLSLIQLVQPSLWAIRVDAYANHLAHSIISWFVHLRGRADFYCVLRE